MTLSTISHEKVMGWCLAIFQTLQHLLWFYAQVHLRDLEYPKMFCQKVKLVQKSAIITHRMK